ncbi:MAG: hypothetical protein KDD75_16820 [Caldilineaceae bacterium]|nr:hypothetical protein [Caldilineaceae bacterium]
MDTEEYEIADFPRLMNGADHGVSEGCDIPDWLLLEMKRDANRFPPPRTHELEHDDITEDEAREALLRLDPLWGELFPAEQARIVQLLVERVDVRMNGVEVRLRPNGLAGLVREVAGSRRAAA